MPANDLPTAVLPVLPPRRDRGRTACWMMLGLTSLGLVLTQSLDGLLTASGLLFLDISLDLPLIGRTGLADAIAVSLLIVALVADLTLANVARIRRGRNGAVLFTLALVALLQVQGMGAFLHYAQLSDLARGANLQTSLVADAAALRARVAAAQDMIDEDYTRALATQARLAADSAAGNDVSGVAARGPLWQTAKAMERQLKAEFADLAGALPVPAAADDAATGFAALMREMDRLRARAALYARMCAALQRVCTDPVAPIVTDLAYARLEQAMGGAEKADRRVLVLTRVGEDIAQLRQGRMASVEMGLLVALALILPFGELFLVVILRATFARLYGGADVDELRQLEARLDEEMEVEARISAKQAFRDVMADGVVPMRDAGVVAPAC